MLLNLANPFDRKKFTDYSDRLSKKGEELESSGGCLAVELTERRPLRSNAQNAYLHVLIGYFACEYGITAEEAKVDVYKRQCNADMFVRKRMNKRGVEVEYLRSSADLTTQEMSQSIERFRNMSSSQYGIYLPSSEDHAFIIYAQQQIKEQDEFVGGITDD